MTPIHGKIWILGDQIDTDLIVPSRVLTEQDPQKLINATLEVVIPEFAKKVRKGDIIIGGKNFGCGSSREEAVFVLQRLGISAIIAPSFARIFYRNAINMGLPPILLPELTVNPPEICSLGNFGDELSIDLDHSIISRKKKAQEKPQVRAQETAQEWSFQPFPPFILAILNNGGIIEQIQKKK